ncbi:hypothetical protein [Blastococcus sp. SYSU D00813]
MSKWFAACGVVLAIGLAVGFWPHSTDSSYYDGLKCGSAFVPDESPSGTQTNFWETELGFGDQTRESYADRAASCSDVLGPARAGALSLVCLAAAGGALVGLRSLAVANADLAAVHADLAATADEDEYVEDEDEYEDEYEDEDEGRDDAREAYWRARGWVPAEEVDGPPPGWVRVDGN